MVSCDVMTSASVIVVSYFGFYSVIMQLTESIARQIVERTMNIIPYSVNVMDDKGRIIASGNPARLQQKHEGAVLAINECRVVEISQATAENLKGVKPGVNLPIIYQGHVIGVIGISGVPDEVNHCGQLVKMTAELIVEQAALMSQIQWNKRHREELVMQLVNGAELDDIQLMAIAERLDVDLSLPRVAMIVKVTQANDTSLPLEQLQHLIQFFEHEDYDNLVGIISVSNKEVVILAPYAYVQNEWNREIEHRRVQLLVKKIRRDIKLSVKIAIGEYFPGIDGVSKSFETAQLTMKAVFDKSDRLFFYQDYKLTALMSDLFRGSWKAEQLRQPYDLLKSNDTKGILIRTLEAYFDQNCDIGLTCKSLHVHRNTLRYRLDKIEQITSLNINRLSDIFQLYLAINIFHYYN